MGSHELHVLEFLPVGSDHERFIGVTTFFVGERRHTLDLDLLRC